MTIDNDHLLKRCAICKSIKIDGESIPESEYDVTFFKKLGYDFSDGYHSKNCMYNFYTFKEIIENNLLEIIESIEKERCN